MAEMKEHVERKNRHYVFWGEVKRQGIQEITILLVTGLRLLRVERARGDQSYIRLSYYFWEFRFISVAWEAKEGFLSLKFSHFFMKL